MDLIFALFVLIVSGVLLFLFMLSKKSGLSDEEARQYYLEKKREKLK